jgi:predicted transcriptional regulator
MIDKNISGAPVCNEKGELVGIISEGDCLKEIVKGQYTNSLNDQGTVADHMAKDVLTIEPNCDILEAASRFLKLKVRRFPVMENGKIIGQISQRDIMRAVSKLKKQTW